MNLPLMLVNQLPENGQWKFEGQRQKWLTAMSLVLDMEMENRQQDAQRRKEMNIRDIGYCEIIILKDKDSQLGQ